MKTFIIFSLVGQILHYNSKAKINKNKELMIPNTFI